MNTDHDQHRDGKERRGSGFSANSASSAFPGRDAFVVALLYVALTIALTWPLARGLSRDIPGDFGDPIFTSWVIAWDATHLGRGWWHANIFYPHPLALAYSEHYLPQALQVLPIYAATRNPILCYNLLFLSTFVLSGLGIFLFGRELTGSRTAGFVAGLAYAFAPYRMASLPHLQVLSSAWLPFVLFGMRRYFATLQLRPLAGATLAWIAQNLSCGYYLLFFSPAIAFYIVWEMITRGTWRDRRMVLGIAAACVVVCVVTVPFLLPYLELRQLGFNPRSLTETRKFSADVYAYFTADPNLWLWGTIAQAWPKAEGLLFPGLTIAVLAAVGALNGARGATPGARGATPGARGATPGARGATPGARGFSRATDRSPAALAIRVLLIIGSGLVVALLLGRSIRLPGVKITSFARALVIASGVSAILLALSPRARATARSWLASPVGLFSVLTLFAIVMSFGPEIHARGRVVAGTNLYAAFYHLVPGFDGLRVPARFGMLATFGLATLAALGLAALERGRQRRARAMAAVAGALVVLEFFAVPIPINQSSADYQQAGLVALPGSIGTGAGVPDVYRFVAQLPASAAIVELPLGEPAFDIRYMFYSTTHWKRLVNGYSGGAPPDYELLTESLEDAATRPDRAWDALVASRATHAIVHEGFYAGDRGPQLSAWIRTRGGREVASVGTDHVFQLR